MMPLKQKKGIRTTVYIALPLMILAAVVCMFLLPSSNSFIRLQTDYVNSNQDGFQVDREKARIHFTKNGEQIRLNNLATMDGYPIYLRGRKLIRIKPAFAGKTGLYSYIYFESQNKPHKIKFKLQRRHGRSYENLRVIETDHLDYPLMQTMDLARSDVLFFTFEGYGIVYFSKPIQYRLRQNSQRRLVILMGIDTLRADRIGRMKNGVSLTPNINAFLQDSVHFSRAFSQSSWTIPAFVSLFTGLNEINHGVGLSSCLAIDKPQLVQNLRNRFICFGIHGGLGLDSYWGYSRGFDFFQELPQTGPLYPRGGESLFQKATEFIVNGRFPDLFLFLHTYQVHAPYTPPPEYLRQIDPHPAFTSLDVENSAKPERTFVPVEPQKRRAMEELYDAEVLAFDGFFGRFIADLRQLGLYDNAMIILLSDHGEEFFEHGGWGHSHSLYDELVRIPLIIKFPQGKFAGRTIIDPAGIIDVLPTVLDYYRIGFPKKSIDGISLLPQIAGQRRRIQLVSSISNSRYIDAIPPKFAIYNWPQKLIVNYPYTPAGREFFRCCMPPPAIPEYELYNLEKDPDEKNNLAASRPEYIEHWKAAILMLKRMIRETAARMQSKALPPEILHKVKTLGYI